MNNKANNQKKVYSVGVDALKMGMVLADDLRHFNGRLIFKSGTHLSPKEIRIIKMWGIPEARILSAGSEEHPQDEPDESTRTDEKIENLARNYFQFSDLKHDVNKELYRLFVSRHIQREAKDSESLFNSSAIEEPWELSEPIDIRQKLDKEVKLPSLPSIVVRINEAISHPNCTATHIADIISKDTSLTARLLKLVNSALYSFPMPIESIPRAVTIIGTKQLSALAMATAVTSTFRNIPSEIIDMKSFWKHCLACGILSRLLASYKTNVNTESYFLSGLLHDIGRLVIYQCFPDYSQALFYRAHKEPNLLYPIEISLFGIHHGEIGSILIEKWQLPTILQNACQFHHTPMEAPDKLVASIIHVADTIAHAMCFGSSGERFVPPLDTAAWEEIGLPASVLPPIIQQTDVILLETIQNYLEND
jgi:HD-like signal output (HDOD) protein